MRSARESLCDLTGGHFPRHETFSRTRDIMRFSLVDLLIAIACQVFGFLVVPISMSVFGYPPLPPLWTMLAGLVLGVTTYLVVTPPLYQRLGLPPLLVPVCPHCRRRPDRYGILNVEWPRVAVECGHCTGQVDLWWKPPAASAVSTTTPSLLLSWPHSIGRWSVLSRDSQ